MKQAGTILLLVMIFCSVVFGYLIVQSTYKKKNVPNYTKLETIHSLQYGDISVERYYRNGANVKAFGFYKDGSMKSEFYLTDNTGYSSKFISYFPNRQIETKSIKWIEGDVKHFIYEEYFENGKTRRREGSKIDKWEYYDEIGELTMINLHDGDRTTETMFFPGGRKQDESEFLKGQRDGHWYQWDSSGTQTKNELYTNGVKIH